MTALERWAIYQFLTMLRYNLYMVRDRQEPNTYTAVYWRTVDTEIERFWNVNDKGVITE